ncbi:MAG: aminotransferase class V-fold PLP-dependent enzyme [Oscillatoriales cyanobacterium RM2_1_1]|nr:aminotransferase class V-fold PLP-dependent enzyme [Oscillatoriales cyanobacterium SM2_3_0]NJO45242.1 aminotransferase class V-fold PLP-dependent enzyme [Oscillatoriales cyanobacterium RM2_1_1]
MNTNALRQHWSLNQDVIYLNHGSFGACPQAVLDYQHQLRTRLEHNPFNFFVREFEPLLDQARNQLADFMGAEASALSFVPNATTGVNCVLRSLCYSEGDELLTTSHEYNACRNALDFVAQRAGATVTVAKIPFPLNSPDQIQEAVLQTVSRRTRLVLLDHVTSQTGLVLPIAALVDELAQRHIDVLVDGAHAPGMLPLNLTQLGAAYYTGNCHKWLCGPKGAAFLYVRPDKQAEIRPLTISHGANSPRSDRPRFQLEFDWMGTADPTAYLSVPRAIQFMDSVWSEGWSGVMAHNHQLVVAARYLLCEGLGVSLPCSEQQIGAMAAIPLPLELAAVDSLQEQLWQRFRIEVPIIPWGASGQPLLRISAQIYNTLAEYQQLIAALKAFTPEKVDRTVVNSAEL